MMSSRNAILAVAALTIVPIACREAASPTNVPAPVTGEPSPPDPQSPTSPAAPTTGSVVASAGLDVLLPFASESATLTGYAKAYGGQIVSYSWTKLSGPGSGSLLTPTSKQTQVANLEIGTHEFQFTVTDNRGKSAQDFVRVVVYDPRRVGANEVVFTNRWWGCFGGCEMTVAVFQPVVPNRTAFKVSLRTGDQWMPIKEGLSPSSDPLWLLENGSEGGVLRIVSGMESLVGPEDVKIVF